MSKVGKKIIHIDMDCFYAQVEMRDNPSLRNVPLAIGGKPGRRSVLCTSNYIAREFGVRSAMSSSEAVRLCPNLVLIPPNFKKYKEASKIIRKVFEKYTDLIEPLSLDEAYLDVSECKHYSGSATLIAKAIKEEVFEKTKLTCSAGVAPNKFLAKVASDWKKPNGLFVITPNEAKDFAYNLPVRKINGVGPVSAQKLKAIGIEKCSDIINIGHEKLCFHFKSFGPTLWQFAHGIDHREVQNEWERKSLSHEETFMRDIPSAKECQDEVPLILEEVRDRLMRFKEEKEPDTFIKKGFIKIKFNDFKSVTVEKSLGPDFFNKLWEEGIIEKEVIDYFLDLTEIAFERRNRPVRLIGVGFRFDQKADTNQLDLFNYKGLDESA